MAVKNLPAVQEAWILSLGQEDPLEKGMATHSSILAWRIPWIESFVGYRLSPCGRKELDMTERLTLSWPFGCYPMSHFIFFVSLLSHLPCSLGLPLSCPAFHTETSLEASFSGQSSMNRLFLLNMYSTCTPHFLRDLHTCSQSVCKSARLFHMC